jgi:hypothetical protein
MACKAGMTIHIARLGRIAALLLFLLSLVVLLFAKDVPERTEQTTSNLPKSFHDEALNITYFYPAHFMPAPSAATPGPSCVKTTLAANSDIAGGASSFVLSTIDNTCPDILREAAALGPFTRAQILRQLRQYGEPRITREPTRYVIDGRAAAITLATVPMTLASGKGVRITYAAKACALGAIPAGRRKRFAAETISRVLCFDFTTENSDLLNLMFAFVIQFDNGPLEPMFLASAYPAR